MTDREIMQQALDALEQSKTLAPFGAEGVVYWEGVKIHEAAIATLRERLAHCDRCGKKLGGPDDIHTCSPQQPEQEPAQQPVQEPVYWEVRCTAHPKWMRVDEQQFDEYLAHGWEGQRLYTSPSQRKPEQEPVACRVCGDKRGSWAWQCNHCGAFDESPQPEQEPVELCERICAAIKSADDKSVSEADYMLDSDDCIEIVRAHFVVGEPTQQQRKPDHIADVTKMVPFQDLAGELFVVAQISPADDGFSDTMNRIEAWLRNHFSTPPQRKPLLASDIVTMYDENPRSDSEMIAFARAIEAKLKEKNNG